MPEQHANLASSNLAGEGRGGGGGGGGGGGDEFLTVLNLVNLGESIYSTLLSNMPGIASLERHSFLCKYAGECRGQNRLSPA